MSEKYVKLFEELDQEGAFDQEGQEEIQEPKEENQPTEEIRDEDSQAEEAAEKLSPGEQRAYDRGLDVLTREQLAAMWIKAKDRIAYQDSDVDSYFCDCILFGFAVDYHILYVVSSGESHGESDLRRQEINLP